jgi:hypothetical protein
METRHLPSPAPPRVIYILLLFDADPQEKEIGVVAKILPPVVDANILPSSTSTDTEGT